MSNLLNPSSAARRTVSRRGFLGMVAGTATAVVTGFDVLAVAAAKLPQGTTRPTSGEGTDLTAEEALARLEEGNLRYIASKAEHPDQTEERRIEVSKGQKPFAVILTCADSRVAPELLFDQGLGDLFVLRTAGNVLADVVVGSIEYAIAELKVPLIVVLGHEGCGAVNAAVSMVTKQATFPGQIGALAKAIGPAVESVKDKSGDLLDNSVKANAVMVAKTLSTTAPILSEQVSGKHLMVVAARYDLDEGRVTLLEA
jgi:carbonic anhydrase